MPARRLIRAWSNRMIRMSITNSRVHQRNTLDVRRWRRSRCQVFWNLFQKKSVWDHNRANLFFRFVAGAAGVSSRVSVRVTRVGRARASEGFDAAGVFSRAETETPEAGFDGRAEPVTFSSRLASRCEPWIFLYTHRPNTLSSARPSMLSNSNLTRKGWIQLNKNFPRPSSREMANSVRNVTGENRTIRSSTTREPTIMISALIRSTRQGFEPFGRRSSLGSRPRPSFAEA